MKNNKSNKIKFILLTLFIVTFIGIVYLYIIPLYYKKKENYEDIPKTTQKNITTNTTTNTTANKKANTTENTNEDKTEDINEDTTEDINIDTTATRTINTTQNRIANTTANLTINSNETTKANRIANTIMNTSNPTQAEIDIPEDSGKCEMNNDVVHVCINYKSCCYTNSNNNSNDCICNHPIVKNCRNQFEKCINNQDDLKIYTKNQLMNKCKEENKSCCIPSNSIAISSDNFKLPIKNEPSTKSICSISSIPNLEQKCMELCQTNPDCKSFSVNNGKIIQSYGVCNLYNDIYSVKQNIDPVSGKPKNDIATDYYIKK